MWCAAQWHHMRLLFFPPIFYNTFRLFIHISTAYIRFILGFFFSERNWALRFLLYMLLWHVKQCDWLPSLLSPNVHNYFFNVCEQKNRLEQFSLKCSYRNEVCCCLPVFFAPYSMRPSVYKAIKRWDLFCLPLFTFKTRVRLFTAKKTNENSLNKSSSLTNIKWTNQYRYSTDFAQQKINDKQNRQLLIKYISVVLAPSGGNSVKLIYNYNSLRLESVWELLN